MKTLEKLNEPNLKKKLGEQVPLEIRTLINASRKGTETADMKNEFLKHLPLSDREKQGLNAIWPTNLIQNVGNMVYQYGDYKLMLSTGVGKANLSTGAWWETNNNPHFLMQIVIMKIFLKNGPRKSMRQLARYWVVTQSTRQIWL